MFDLFPMLKERLSIAKLCKGVGLATDAIKTQLKGEVVTNTGKLHSPEHNQSFNVQDAKLHLLKERDTPKIFLSVNGENIIDCFKQKYQEVKRAVRPHIKPVQLTPKIGRGI